MRELTQRYERELEQNPSDTFLHWALGHLYDIRPLPGAENLRRIVAFFEKAAEIEPENPRYQFDAGFEVWLKRDYLVGNPSEIAFGYLEKAVRLDPGNVSYRTFLAGSYFDEKRYADAIRHMREVVKVRPGENFALGRYYLAAGQDEKARQAFERCLALHPNDPYALSAVANLYSEKKLFNAARSLLEQSLRFGVTQDTCSDIAHMYHKSVKFEEAEKYYRLALRFRYRQGVDNYFSGIIYFELGNMFFDNLNYQAAADAYRKAIELGNPLATDGVTYHKLGESLSQLGRHKEAIEAIQKAVAQYPEDASYHKSLGDAYFAAGNSIQGHSGHYRVAESVYLHALEVGMDGNDAEAVRLKIDEVRERNSRSREIGSFAGRRRKNQDIERVGPHWRGAAICGRNPP